ncbi:MAG: hypothetical protein MJ219_01230 [Mycoplasmoidaceae bacterium]|nr:hypothetical protein [Mycoplasmoidaceae bacterium]
MTVDELYRIVNAYENKEFKDNYFPKLRLRTLNQNNFELRTAEFQLEVVNQILSEKFKPYEESSR